MRNGAQRQGETPRGMEDSAGTSHRGTDGAAERSGGAAQDEGRVGDGGAAGGGRRLGRRHRFGPAHSHGTGDEVGQQLEADALLLVQRVAADRRTSAQAHRRL